MSIPRTLTKSEQQARRAVAQASGLYRAARRRLGLARSESAPTPAAPPAHTERRAQHGDYRSGDDLTLRRGEFATLPRQNWKRPQSCRRHLPGQRTCPGSLAGYLTVAEPVGRPTLAPQRPSMARTTINNPSARRIQIIELLGDDGLGFDVLRSRLKRLHALTE